MTVGVSDKKHLTPDKIKKIVFLFCYRCYYPHTLRDLVSPVCGIVFSKTTRTE